MSQLVRFELDKGGTVLVEPINEDGIVRASNNPGATLRNAISSFETAFCGVRTAAADTLRQFTSLPHQPEEVTIEFGVRLDLAAGAVIARTAVEAHLKVTLLWKRTDQAEPPRASVQPEEPKLDGEPQPGPEPGGPQATTGAAA